MTATCQFCGNRSKEYTQSRGGYIQNYGKYALPYLVKRPVRSWQWRNHLINNRVAFLRKHALVVDDVLACRDLNGVVMV